jgi:hypothetical protein
MSTWSWRTTAAGFVEVDKGDGVFQRITWDKTIPQLEKTKQWIELAREKSTKYNVPLHWILGVITAESGGDPSAHNWCCYGLMAIYLKVHNKTSSEMADPDTNLDYGTSLLASSVKKDLDLPQTASVHNAGGGTTGTPWASSKSPWGMRENTSYIENVVKSANWFLDFLGTYEPVQEPIPVATPRQTFTTMVLMTSGFAIGYLGLDAVRELADRRIRATRLKA